mgnify:FL=1
MKYKNGDDIRPGDKVAIGGQARGTVVASMDTQEYLPGAECWAYLARGVMIDTDFGGLVHYTASSVEELTLMGRTR